jgi:hypothetical protein
MLGLAHGDETVSCYEQHAWSSFIPGIAEHWSLRYVS